MVCVCCATGPGANAVRLGQAPHQVWRAGEWLLVTLMPPIPCGVMSGSGRWMAVGSNGSTGSLVPVSRLSTTACWPRHSWQHWRCAAARIQSSAFVRRPCCLVCPEHPHEHLVHCVFAALHMWQWPHSHGTAVSPARCHCSLHSMCAGAPTKRKSGRRCSASSSTLPR